MITTPCQAHDKESAKKLTAVEWLANKIQEQLNIFFPGATLHYEMINQAKEMEKEQKANTWNNAINAVERDKWESFDQYYAKTFKSDEQE